MVKDINEKNKHVGCNNRVLEALRDKFPGCFNSNGEFDMEVFSAMVQENVAVAHEGYGMNFLGKSYAQLLASLDTTTVIVPDTEHNSKPENANSENVYISGDNLDALKHLLKSYTGKVKCIYIDPPYNTGSDGFVYNDRFNFSSEQLQARLGISEERAARILDLTTRGAASHSAWLTFMLPRLELAKDLLSPYGVIFISIDDNEQANLKILCDYVFGEENMIANFIVKSNPKGRQSDTFCATVHDYLVCYANDATKARIKGMELTDEQRKEYKYDDGDGRMYRLLGLRQRGSDSLREDRPDMYFPIYVNPESNEVSLEYREGWEEVTPHKSDGREGRWMWGLDKCTKEINRLVPRFVKQRNQYDLDVKDYLVKDNEEERTTKLKSIWDSSDYSTEVGTREVSALLGGDYASYPKSSMLLKTILESVVEDGDIVLDFFAGSGTTADAVMQILSSDTETKLNFILIQLPEDLESRIESASNGDKKRLQRLIDFLEEQHYPHTLDYLGLERVKRAGKKYKSDCGLYTFDYGFKHYTLTEPTDNTLARMDRFDPMEAFGLNILDEFGVATVLQTWMMRDGYGFNAKVEEVKLADYTAYQCGRHLYLINEDMSDDSIMALVKLYNEDLTFKPENVALFGYSFNYSTTEELKKNIATLKDGIKNLRVNIDIRY